MTDLIVVGAGVFGSTLTSMARLQGMDVVLVDPAPRSAASRSALAVMKATWSPVAAALDWYTLNAEVFHGARVSNWRAPAKAEFRRDWYTVDPADVLLEPDVQVKAVGWEVPGRLLLADGQLLRAHTVALSHPVWTDVKPTSWGATAFSREAEVDGGDLLRAHWLRPYHCIFAIRTNGVTRVGSSVEATRDAAIARAREMVAEATDLGLVSRVQDWTYSAGLRWPESEERQEPGLVRLGGLARLGFTLAPARARAILDRLEKGG